LRDVLVCQAKWPEQGWKKVGIGRSEMGDQNWKRVFGGDANRPRATGGLSVSGEDQIGAEQLSRIADSLERIEKIAKAFIPPEAAGPKYLNTAQVAMALDRSEPYVMKMCRDQKIEAAKVGGKWLVPVDAVDAMVKANRWKKG